jgi:hypothetical protein
VTLDSRHLTVDVTSTPVWLVQHTATARVCAPAVSPVLMHVCMCPLCPPLCVVHRLC